MEVQPERILRAVPCAATRVDRARRGDRAVLTELYLELAPAVIGYLRGAGAREPDDLAGDVFVAMIKGLSNFEGDEAALRRWVFVIAHHRLIDDRRRAAMRPAGPPLSAEHDAVGSDPYDRVVDRMAAAPIVDALDALTCDQRAVVLLRTVAGLSVADTAVVLGKRSGAVKTLHRRALAALARAVDREEVS